MLLSTRLKRLLHADTHALIKGLENPHALLESAIMSMENIIDDTQKSLIEKQNLFATNRELLEKLNAQLDKTDEALSICLSQDDESLARHTIRRKLILEQEIIKLNDHKEVLLKEINTLQNALQENQEKLDEIKLRAANLDLGSDERSAPSSNSNQPLIREEDISIRLLQEKHKRGLSHE